MGDENGRDVMTIKDVCDQRLFGPGGGGRLSVRKLLHNENLLGYVDCSSAIFTRRRSKGRTARQYSVSCEQIHIETVKCLLFAYHLKVGSKCIECSGGGNRT